MSEWVKILASALAGVAAGVLIEPLRHRMELTILARDGHKAIYDELARVYVTVSTIGRTRASTTDTVDLVRSIRLDAFEFYYGQRREAFYQIKDWSDLLYTCRSLKVLLDQAAEGDISGKFATDIDAIFQTRFKAGRLDRGLIMKYADKFQSQINAYGA
jgi:hypothetical protein